MLALINLKLHLILQIQWALMGKCAGQQHFGIEIPARRMDEAHHFGRLTHNSLKYIYYLKRLKKIVE